MTEYFACPVTPVCLSCLYLLPYRVRVRQVWLEGKHNLYWPSLEAAFEGRR
jgi:hypothetical protein